MENQENEIIELAEYQPEETEEYEETAEEKSGMGTGLAMLIGGGLTLAGIAAVKFAKKKYRQLKARKEMVFAEPDELFEEVPAHDDRVDLVDVDVDDEITK